MHDVAQKMCVGERTKGKPWIIKAITIFFINSTRPSCSCITGKVQSRTKKRREDKSVNIIVITAASCPEVNIIYSDACI